MQIDGRLRFVANRALGIAKILPHSDNDEGEQHGIEDADDGEFEPGNLVVQAEPVHAVEKPRPEHETNGVGAGCEDEQKGQAPRRKRLGQVETHCRDDSPSGSRPLVPETGTMRLLVTSPSWGGPV